jgi:hypothetical protein
MASIELFALFQSAGTVQGDDEAVVRKITFVAGALKIFN